MSTSYSFNDTQKKYLAELMSDKNNKLCASLIYNIGGVSGGGSIDIKDLDFSNETVNDTQKKIVAVATSSVKYGISARSGYCQMYIKLLQVQEVLLTVLYVLQICGQYQATFLKFLSAQLFMDIHQANTVMSVSISATVWLLTISVK